MSHVVVLHVAVFHKAAGTLVDGIVRQVAISILEAAVAVSGGDFKTSWFQMLKDVVAILPLIQRLCILKTALLPGCCKNLETTFGRPPRTPIPCSIY